jgi:hypothetical protein
MTHRRRRRADASPSRPCSHRWRTRSRLRPWQQQQQPSGAHAQAAACGRDESRRAERAHTWSTCSLTVIRTKDEINQQKRRGISVTDSVFYHEIPGATRASSCLRRHRRSPNARPLNAVAASSTLSSSARSRSALSQLPSQGPDHLASSASQRTSPSQPDMQSQRCRCEHRRRTTTTTCTDDSHASGPPAVEVGEIDRYADGTRKPPPPPATESSSYADAAATGHRTIVNPAMMR